MPIDRKPRGLGTLPLAPLANIRDENQLRAVIGRMKGRFDREVSQNESNLLWTATKILMGMKYSDELVTSLLQEVQGMKGSVTYQAIVEEGVVKGERRIMLLFGQKKLGKPSPDNLKRIEEIVDESTLSLLADRLFDDSTWDELLSGL